MRRCPQATEADRDGVFIHLQKASLDHVRGSEDIDADGFPSLQQQPSALVDPSNYIDFSNSPDLLLLASQQQSALDTLAEVSRHHLDYSELHRTSFSADQGFNDNDRGQALAEQALAAQLQQATNESQSAPVAADNVPDPVIDGESLQPGINVLDAGTSLSGLRSDQGHPQHPNVAITARSAIDPELHSKTPGLQETVSSTKDDRDEMASTIVATPKSGLASDHQWTDHPMPGLASLVKPTRGRVRGRFSDTRRKEVSDLRKCGACIRCRMLKKSCSEGTPCNSCSHLESARIWKAKCLRTRLADECTLWCAKLFHAKAAVVVAATGESGLPHEIVSGPVDFRIATSEDLVLRFHARALRLHRITDHPVHGFDTTNSYLWVLMGEENIPEKLGPHLMGLADSLAESEKDALIKGTLKRAIRHAHEESAASPVSNTPQKTRSCYSLSENLVRASIELWTATSLLCGRHDLVPAAPPTSSDASALASENAVEAARLQLLAAIESLSATLAKNVVNALERRLMQRQQASRLATLLSTILLLHAMARMSALYERFEAQDSSTTTNGFRQWPLDVPPSKLCAQAEQLADILVNLLQMRALPPEVKTSAERTLVVVTSFVQMGRKVFDDSMLPPENQSSLLSDWLDPLQIDVRLLVAAKNGTDYEGMDKAELEELRHIAKLLLPMEPKL